MNILIVHEIDWLKKVIFEPHHLAELFSLKGHEVFVVDCEESNIKKVANGLHTSVLSQYNRVLDMAELSAAENLLLELVQMVQKIDMYLRGAECQ